MGIWRWWLRRSPCLQGRKSADRHWASISTSISTGTGIRTGVSISASTSISTLAATAVGECWVIAQLSGRAEWKTGNRGQ